MTKLLVWVTFIFMVGISISYHDNFSKRCNEAGGMAALTLSSAVCFHPSSILEVEK
jgi:hypothetical protein